ncbi:hypothetical protein WOLCODRAFT_140197 [Wolfiporia cocos MD-104 SS10]|uniref:Uncharacterized protein n=1 Tax=Wolfiporia cocos (strain MD-104) TaxID=742152 RepID=A0A2H3JBD3_WOLCO|nr:hypothetical protein WOLCODRAFT_140197 [Wolfiporia cocos MD-104 SS10]
MRMAQLRVLQLLASEYCPFLLVITNVNKLDFERCIEMLRENSLQCLREYIGDHQLLIIKCPGAVHSAGGSAIQTWMYDLGRVSQVAGTIYAIQNNENTHDPRIIRPRIPDFNFTVASLECGKRNLIFAEVSNSETWFHVANKAYATLTHDKNYLGAIIFDVKEKHAWQGFRAPEGWNQRRTSQYADNIFEQGHFAPIDSNAPWGPVGAMGVTWHYAIAHATLYVILREDLPYFADIIQCYPTNHRRRLDTYVCMRVCGHSDSHPNPGHAKSVKARLHLLYCRVKDAIAAHATSHQDSGNRSDQSGPPPPHRHVPEDYDIEQTWSIIPFLEHAIREGHDINLEFSDSDDDDSDYIAKEAQRAFLRLKVPDPVQFLGISATRESEDLTEGLLTHLDTAVRIGTGEDAYSRWGRWHRKMLPELLATIDAEALMDDVLHA